MTRADDALPTDACKAVGESTELKRSYCEVPGCPCNQEMCGEALGFHCLRLFLDPFTMFHVISRRFDAFPLL